MYLLDTDVVIWQLRRRHRVVELLESLSQEGQIGISALTRLEVRFGMKDNERNLTEAFLSHLETYSVTAAIADLAGDYMREYRRRGITLGQIDAAIAATAEAHSLVLVTANARHYPMPSITLLPVSL